MRRTVLGTGAGAGSGAKFYKVCPSGTSFWKQLRTFSRRNFLCLPNFGKMSGAVTKFALPGPLRTIGKKHIEQATQWIPTASVFGATAGCTLLYFTDWKAVLQYFPFYNGKFKDEESSS